MSYNVLVVDDNATSRELISEILKETSDQYNILQSETGEDGLKVAQSKKPDLLILDIKLPDLSGFEVIKRLKKSDSTKDIPVLMVTAYDNPENINNSFNLGAYDYITKPINVDEFKSRVKKTLSINESISRIKTQLKKSEKEIFNLEQRAFISNTAINSFIIVNNNGELDWANDGFKTIHGYTIDDFKNKFGNTIFSLYRNTEIVDLFTTCIRDKKTVSFISEILDKGGNTKWIQTFISPHYGKDNEVGKLLAVENDITTLRAKEEELNKLNKQITNITDELEKANYQLEKQKDELRQQHELIEVEQAKSERLILNILPFEVAVQLKSKGRAGTRQYKLVSVIFTDFKGFSKISKQLEPKDLVNILDTYFAKFDDITSRHYLEKIKTIGDSYMCAGGLPLRNKSNPINAVLASLEIQDYMNRLNDSRVVKNLSVWELRLGIHTGEVVAGVVGRKKFAYDIWGETVNIARRMEQAGHVGMVNISGTTYDYVKDYFKCDYRGKIDAKNIGKIDQYFVNRIIPELSADQFGYIPNQKFLNIINQL
ncbi:MAG: response regulator [Bacteroidales bacterium]|nr:response regulator [Bacteroidales bacterium]